MCIYGLSSDGQSDTGCGHMDSYHAPKISSPASLKQFDCHQERKQTDMGFFCHSTHFVQHSTVVWKKSRQKREGSLHPNGCQFVFFVFWNI